METMYYFDGENKKENSFFDDNLNKYVEDNDKILDCILEKI